MNREGIQKELHNRIKTRIKQLKITDTTAIFTFDEHIQAHTDFNREDLKFPILNNSIETLQTGWGASNISQALIEATEKLLRICDEKKITKADIEIFTDLQEDESIEQLQQFPWPENLNLIVQTFYLQKNLDQ